MLVRSTINLYCNDPEVERIWYDFNFATEKKNVDRILRPAEQQKLSIEVHGLGQGEELYR